jgi:LysR family transcriptional regulator for bpeEF and oprC
MDRLRALQYFIASAEEGSFSAAARKLEVTIPAVAKLVSSLERDIGVSLFERSAHGLSLTAAGESYLEACQPSVERLREAHEQIRGSGVRVRGTVVVGVQHFVAHSILAPVLPQFHARHPDVTIDLRESTQVTNVDAPGIDIFISLSWPQHPDMIHRGAKISRFVVCASPAYWSAHGVPRHPGELANHTCLLVRTQTGTVMDLWNFEHAGEKVSVAVKGWAVANNVHRDSILRLAEAGEGVVRVLDWASRRELENHSLVPVLTEWALPDAPPVALSYRPSARRTARVRVLIDYLMEVFRDLERANAQTQLVARAPPHWANVRMGRASATVPRRPGK